MKNRALLVVLMLLAMLVVAFIAAPVISGEHPWDSDFDGDGDILDPDINDPFYTGDTIKTPDTSVVGGSSDSSAGGSLLGGLLTGAWSAMISFI